MILITSDENDITTDYVIDWLLYFKVTFKRINSNQLNTLSIIINDKEIDLNLDDTNDYSRVWHRRGRYCFFFPKIDHSLRSKINDINNYLLKEEITLLTSVENQLKSKINYIGSYLDEININKLDALICAKKHNLKIPSCLITNSKEELQDFYKSHNEIITKDLHYPVNFRIENIRYTSIGTFIVKQEMIDELETNFFPIFVQEKINKKYEIRIFMYKEKLFSMAIFSQKNEKTKVDYRNYDNVSPNRTIPINLPTKIEDKIINLTKDLKINTCSIDIIINESNEYIFLEINPMGQLDWVSFNCNYYIEKFIAEDLRL